MPRRRLDHLLVERGLAPDLDLAARWVRAGLVYTNSARLEKPGMLIDAAESLTVKSPESPFVSRGGLKLQGALRAFSHNPNGETAVDLGASTGGFTDCLLQYGARRVYAIDVGRGQLHQRLLTDPRVHSRERTHFDKLAAGDFANPPTLVVADLSFISLARAYPVIWRIMPDGGRAILLAKPQFEVTPDALPPGGVLRDPAIQQEVLDRLTQAAAQIGFALLGRCESPIHGADGNREFFLYLDRPSSS